jgi:5-methylthioribose kinase
MFRGLHRKENAFHQPMIDIEDNGQLLQYLRESGRIGGSEKPTIRKLSGGVSNKTLLLTRSGGESWVIKQSLPKLRVASDWFSDPARIQVEANGLRYLPLVTPQGSIAPLLFEDPAQNILAMESVPQPHQNWKQQLLSGDIDLQLFQQFARLLGSIHREGTRLRHQLAPYFGSKQFFRTLRLEPYYGESASVAPEAASFIEELVNWTLSRADTLVHGDFSPKNVLVYRQHLILLDHEVLHLGDPAFDVGFSLTHFLSKALHLPRKRDGLLAAAGLYWQCYRHEVRGLPWAPHLDFRAAQHTLASLLARVCGRSPLEYLSREESLLQRRIVIEMIKENSATVDLVISAFAQKLADESHGAVS